MALAALLLYLLGLVLAFGVRTFIAWWRTGDSGFRRPDTVAFSAPWWGTVLFAAALILGLAAPVAALTGWLAPPAAFAHPVLSGAGIAVMTGALVLVLAAQLSMGTSWRIGVDTTEHTELVTTGIFAVARNPVFSAMAIMLAGMVAAVPTVLSLAAFIALVAAVQIQVRAIEEPYLVRTHPAHYPAYTARTGRFLPGLGRIAR